MYGALILFEDEFIHIVAISFTALILTELIMVALTIRTWHRLMVLAELFSLVLYLISLFFFKQTFGKFFLILINKFIFLLIVCPLRLGVYLDIGFPGKSKSHYSRLMRPTLHSQVLTSKMFAAFVRETVINAEIVLMWHATS
jgi:hypothetical protein